MLIRTVSLIFVTASIFTRSCVRAQRIIRNPSNITRSVGETDVFIPCPFEFSPTPANWRINETVFSVETLPSNYSVSPGGLFINEVTPCLDQTSFQCIDTSNDGLIGQESSIGFVSVTPGDGICIGNDLQSPLTNEMELNHRLISYGQENTTLSWQIFTDGSNCTVSHLQFNPPCDITDVTTNITTTNTSYTISSEILHVSGQPADINLSSASVPPGSDCPRLPSVARFNVSETDTATVLLSRDFCSCIEISCEGSLGTIHVAIPNPDVTQKDLICNAGLSSFDSQLPACYDSSRCQLLNDSDIPAFFRIRENPSDRAKCAVCFKNLNKLNGLRLDFFGVQNNLCAGFYYNRLYFKSIILNVTAASANFVLNKSSGEICFSSASRDCNFTDFTQYNVSITDITGNLWFMNESIPESTCTTIRQPLLPQCSPLLLFYHPSNDYIIYNSMSKVIPITDDEDNSIGNVCSCVNETIQLNLSVTASGSHPSFWIDYLCSTDYLSSINITIRISQRDESEVERIIPCQNGNISINVSDCQSKDYDIVGYWLYLNESTINSCLISSIKYTVPYECPTSSPPRPTMSCDESCVVAIAVTAAVTVPSMIIILIILIIIGVWYMRRRGNHDGPVHFHGGGGGGGGVDIPSDGATGDESGSSAPERAIIQGDGGDVDMLHEEGDGDGRNVEIHPEEVDCAGGGGNVQEEQGESVHSISRDEDGDMVDLLQKGHRQGGESKQGKAENAFNATKPTIIT